jgi:hypothetical protein
VVAIWSLATGVDAPRHASAFKALIGDRGEPKFHQLEPARRVAARPRGPPTGSLKHRSSSSCGDSSSRCRRAELPATSSTRPARRYEREIARSSSSSGMCGAFSSSGPIHSGCCRRRAPRQCTRGHDTETECARPESQPTIFEDERQKHRRHHANVERVATPEIGQGSRMRTRYRRCL